MSCARMSVLQRQRAEPPRTRRAAPAGTPAARPGWSGWRSPARAADRVGPSASSAPRRTSRSWAGCRTAGAGPWPAPRPSARQRHPLPDQVVQRADPAGPATARRAPVDDHDPGAGGRRQRLGVRVQQVAQPVQRSRRRPARRASRGTSAPAGRPRRPSRSLSTGGGPLTSRHVPPEFAPRDSVVAFGMPHPVLIGDRSRPPLRGAADTRPRAPPGRAGSSAASGSRKAGQRLESCPEVGTGRMTRRIDSTLH